MLIDTRLLTFTAPPELTRLVAALRRRESVCDLCVSFSLYLARYPTALSNELKSLRFRIAASPSLMRRATLGPS